MKVVVLGGSGEIGSRVVANLRNREIGTVADAERATGVDTYTGNGLKDAIDGADAVVDCTNIATTKAPKAIDFFTTSARTIAKAARDTGVKRLVVVSIVNVDDPKVNAKLGYYQGKTAQEKTYRDTAADGTLAIVRTTQWYELGRQILDRARFGPVALVPHMKCQPLAAREAAKVVADAVTATEAADIEVAGPEVLDIFDIATLIARKEGRPRWVRGIDYGGPAIRDGGLLPRGEYLTAHTTMKEWIEGHPDPHPPSVEGSTPDR
ncbi:NAD(P)H-binding protein [Gordonia sinesedis]